MNAVAQSAGLTRPAISSADRTGSLTVAQTVDRYMAEYAGRDSSRAPRLRFWCQEIGRVRLADLTDDPIFDALARLEARAGRYYAGKDAEGRPIFKAKNAPMAPATRNRYLAAISAVLTWAVKKRLVPRSWTNPCRNIELVREDNQRVRFLSDDERARLLVACRASAWPKLYALVLLALTTGARKGELLGLRGRDIDLDQAIARVDRTKNNDRKVLPLVPAVVEELRLILPTNEDALVFGSPRWPDVPYSFESGWHSAMKAAKLRNFKFHDLRHSCASYLAQNGATLLEIADVLGHRQLSVTRRYSHLTVQHKAKLVTRVLGGIR